MPTPKTIKPKILVVDDEPDAVELLEFNLRNSGFEVISAEDGNSAIKKAREQKADLVLLDVMLPEVDGLEVCKILRRDPATAKVPIIMLTAKAAEIDRVLGLEFGADDYITKPFSVRELILRIKGLMRRVRGDSDPDKPLRAGLIEIDPEKFMVTVKGKKVDLTATEFKLLHLLVKRRGRVQSRDQLLRDVWEYEGSVDTRTVDTHIRRLRDKIGAASECLETIRGVGYRYIES